MTVRLAIPGQREAVSSDAARGASAGGIPTAPVTNLLAAVEVVEAFNLSVPARDRTVVPQAFDARDDDILEIEVEGGFTLWTSAERYAKEVSLLKPDAIAADGRVTVDSLPRTSVFERGVREWFQSALKVLRLGPDAIAQAVEDPSRWPTDFVEEFGLRAVTKLSAWLATKLAIRLIEDHLTPGPGLYTWADATAPRKGDGPKPPAVTFDGSDVEKPVLVFIHGTASSTLGSFGAFLTTDAREHWRGLHALFDDRIYAFEHRTMSESPIDNAIQLVRALPRRARLSVVSHSRGGMVGDLVCLTSVDANQIARFDRRTTTLKDADAHDRASLERLAALIAEKQLRVERFVRCASPARGTLLASENIDTFLSVLTNLVGLIPGLAGSPLYEVVKRTTLQIVKNRTNPELVPGLEAMMPTSPVVALLNAAGQGAAGALGVVAGDIEGGGWLKRLGVFLTDHCIYENRDNDLVVNTDSMFHGARRARAHYVFDQGADVSHFNYFKNERTRASLLAWLSARADEAPGGFRELTEGEIEPVPMLRSLQTRAGAAQPIAFVLPGIMGSHLAIGDNRVWLNYLALASGGLADLTDIAAGNIQPASLVGDYYRPLCVHLANTHEVVPFAFDWRKSVRAGATLLAGEVEKALARTTQPVRLLAHGMGGLVARALIAARPDLWDRICEREGGRFVMLGTPNRGSHAIVEVLLGTAATVQQLALLDGKLDTRAVATIFAGFPGVLECLPSEATFFTDATWTGFTKQGGTGAVPNQANLAAARAVIDGLGADTPLPHVDRVLYVAGSSARTVRKVQFVNDRLVFEATTEGDSRVTYQSGRLPGVATWYMEAEHGDLASHEPAFPAIVELLERGTTTRLPVAPLSTARGGEAVYRSLPEPVLYPTEAALTVGLLGQRRPKAYKPRVLVGFRVSVMHGDLRFARFPIMVGHYQGDTIVGAEWQIDRKLDGALSHRYNLGLYPGELGSVAVVLREPTAIQRVLGLPNGAIIVGLGKWGDLTAAQLANLIRRAALQYVLQLDDAAGVASDVAGEVPAETGLSILLIGGNSTANISTEDSVGAILRGIAQANREIGANAKTRTRIGEVEVIELFADTAIEAGHAANRIAKAMAAELQTTIDVRPLLTPGRGGRQRLTPVGATRDPWRRWEITVVRPLEGSPRPQLAKPLADRLKRAIVATDKADPELLAALAELALVESAPLPEPHRELKFISLSDRARAEVIQQQRQPELVERLIRDSVAQTALREKEARALFQLMIPNDLKEGLAQLSRVVLVVDAETAAYPWELMMDGPEPLCTRMGMVRQLQTARFRAHIRATTTQAAYVVGDPLVSPPYKQLSGARAEAGAVAELLKTRFDVTHSPERLSALEVLGGLYEGPYRIVHLAGHGQYEPATTSGGHARSGMVLDNGVFLTAVEIGQMPQVPELVFLNCCHIGQVGPEAPPATLAPTARVEFNRLAASVARELIEMGVRAVVAAGWAVRDDAALHFAESFYTRMLAGDSFGRALQFARHDTWRRPQFRDCNTWGAYQAYGDPDFRFDPAGAATPRGDMSHVAVAEFVDVIEGLTRGGQELDRVPGGAAPPRQSAAERLEALVKGCPPEWLARSEVLMAIGFAYGEVGRLDAASRYLAAALESDGSATTLRAVDQLANFEARVAEASAGDGRDAVKLTQSIQGLTAALSRLEKLLAVAETAERHSLLGSSYKRLAAVQVDAEAVRQALGNAADSYRRAHEQNLARNRFDPYPVLNWLTCQALLGQPVAEGDTLLARCEAAARERFAATRQFFEAVAIPDSQLVRALAGGVLGADTPQAAREVKRLADLYLDAFKTAQPSAREINSVATQIKLIESLIQKLRGDEAASITTRKALAALRRAIAGEATAEGASAPESGAAAPAARPSDATPAGPTSSRRKGRTRKLATKGRGESGTAR